jgi:hypothetical protein
MNLGHTTDEEISTGSPIGIKPVQGSIQRAVRSGPAMVAQTSSIGA